MLFIILERNLEKYHLHTINNATGKKQGPRIMTYRKKLIEVALPLDAINEVPARAGILAQMVNDPSAHTDLFPIVKETEETF